MCRALGVNRTSFHDWERRAPSDHALSDAWLTEKIKQVHAASDSTYGARRVHAELRLEHGVRVGRKRVERLMKAAAISGVLARKRRRTTVRLPGVRVARDLLERDFRPGAPNLTWSADITYISTWEGFLYLAHVQDLFSRLIVGWSMADHLRAELVVDALEMALHRRRPHRGLVHHSDQGCQPSTPRCCSSSAALRPGSRSRWAQSATATTTPSAKRSTRASRRNASTGVPGRPGLRPEQPCSSTSRAGTTPAAGTPPSATSPQPSTNATTIASQPPASPSPATAQSLPRSPSMFHPISLRPRRTAVNGRTELAGLSDE
jgi:transposase InsO family protein